MRSTPGHWVWVTNPKRSPESVACAQWLQALVATGSRVVLPEIADYEVRRELLRGNRAAGLQRLDALVSLVEYVPLTTAAMRHAAAFWAEARQRGRPTDDDKALDGDVILAAQVATLESSNGVVATTKRRSSLALRPGGTLAGHPRSLLTARRGFRALASRQQVAHLPVQPAP